MENFMKHILIIMVAFFITYFVSFSIRITGVGFNSCRDLHEANIINSDQFLSCVSFVEAETASAHCSGVLDALGSPNISPKEYSKCMDRFLKEYEETHHYILPKHKKALYDLVQKQKEEQLIKYKKHNRLE